jgi:hypothetical protein
VSGNPGGRPRAALDVQALARAHTKAALQTLVDCLRDPKHKLAAACALLDRGWGRPAQAILAQVGTGEPVRYEFYWANATTNKLPEAEAPTIDATAAASNGDDGEAKAEPMLIDLRWGDGSKVTG